MRVMHQISCSKKLEGWFKQFFLNGVKDFWMGGRALITDFFFGWEGGLRK